MGLFDLFGSDATCPACGSNAAKKLLFFVDCPNRACVNGGAKPAPKPEPRRGPGEWPLNPGFQPGASAVTVRYRNFLDEERSFTGDRRTIRDYTKRLSLCVAPSGERLSLAKDRILNLPEVQPEVSTQAAPVAPKGKDLQILNYHRKHSSTSKAYEEILERHPEWR